MYVIWKTVPFPKEQPLGTGRNLGFVPHSREQMHKGGIMQNAAVYFSVALKEATDSRSQHVEDSSSCSSCWKDLRRPFISGISSRQGQQWIHIMLPRAFFQLCYGDLRSLLGCPVPCVVILTVNILTSIQNLSLSIYDDCLLFCCHVHVLHEKLPC